MESLLAQQAAAAATSMFAGISPPYRLVPGARRTPSPLQPSTDNQFSYPVGSSCVLIPAVAKSHSSGKGLERNNKDLESADSQTMDSPGIVARSQESLYSPSKLPESNSLPINQNGIIKCSIPRPWPTPESRFPGTGPRLPEFDQSDRSFVPFLNLFTKMPLDMSEKMSNNLSLPPLPSSLLPNINTDEWSEARWKQAQIWQTMLTQLSRLCTTRTTSLSALDFQWQRGENQVNNPKNSDTEGISPDLLPRWCPNSWLQGTSDKFSNRVGPSAFREPTAPSNPGYPNSTIRKDPRGVRENKPATPPCSLTNQLHLGQYLKSLLHKWQFESYDKQSTSERGENTSIDDFGFQSQRSGLGGPTGKYPTGPSTLQKQIVNSNATWISQPGTETLKHDTNFAPMNKTIPIKLASFELQTDAMDLASPTNNKASTRVKDERSTSQTQY